MKGRVLRTAVLVLSVAVIGAGVYKWVDEEGVSHYSDTAPREQRAREMDIQPGVPPGDGPAKPATRTWQEQEQAFQKRRAERERKEREARTGMDSGGDVDALRAPLKAGRYVTTTRTTITYAMQGDILGGRLGLTIKGNPAIQREAWVRAVFLVPLPDTHDATLITNPDPPRQVLNVPADGLLRIRPGEEVSIETPEVAHLRCRYYEADVLIFSDDRGSDLLDQHVQHIRAWIDGTRVRSSSQLNAVLYSARGKASAPRREVAGSMIAL